MSWSCFEWEEYVLSNLARFIHSILPGVGIQVSLKSVRIGALFFPSLYVLIIGKFLSFPHKSFNISMMLNVMKLWHFLLLKRKECTNSYVSYIYKNAYVCREVPRNTLYLLMPLPHGPCHKVFFLMTQVPGCQHVFSLLYSMISTYCTYTTIFRNTYVQKF